MTAKPIVSPDRLKTHQRYKSLAGKVLPGFSTIMGMVAKPALIKWAWNLGRDGIDLGKSQQQAFDIGTCAHFLCECHINGWEADLSGFAPKDVSLAENGFLRFLDFWKGFELVRSEVQMADSHMGYGGTADIIARDADGQLALIDIKTSKAVYLEYEVQLAAYKRLWDWGSVEMVDGDPTDRDFPGFGHDSIKRMICVRIGKEEEGDLEVRDVPMSRYDDLVDFFFAALKLYQAKQRLEKRK